MYFAAVLTTAAVFSYVGTAVSENIKLSGVQRPQMNVAKVQVVNETPTKNVTLDHVKDLHATNTAVHSSEQPKALMANVNLQARDIHPNNDSDRRLAPGGIRGTKTENKNFRKRFAADVAMPIQLQMKDSGGSNRRLQTAQCFEQPDGLLACVLEGFPGDDFATVFLDCPVVGDSILDCPSCTIVVTNDSTPGEIDLANDPQCSSCSVCTDNVAYDCSNLASGTCVTQNCAGDCVNSSGTDPTPTSPPAPAPTPSSGPTGEAARCTPESDGSLVCLVEDYPADGFDVILADCPSTATSIFECGSCAVVSDDVNVCTSCTVCSDVIAFDCANIASGDCAVLDCNGDCSSSSTATPPPPTTSPPTSSPPTTSPPTTSPPATTSPPTAPGTPPPTTSPGQTTTPPPTTSTPGPSTPTPTSSSASTRSLGVISFSATVTALVLGFFM